jgi:exoribonuclease R
MHSILAEFGLPYDFPEEVELAAEAIPVAIPKEENQKTERLSKGIDTDHRPDRRKGFPMTRSSYRILKNGNTEIGVHIADVSHYDETRKYFRSRSV